MPRRERYCISRDIGIDKILLGILGLKHGYVTAQAWG